VPDISLSICRWAEDNECLLNPGFMRSTCVKACRVAFACGDDFLVRASTASYGGTDAISRLHRSPCCAPDAVVLPRAQKSPSLMGFATTEETKAFSSRFPGLSTHPPAGTHFRYDPSMSDYLPGELQSHLTLHNPCVLVKHVSLSAARRACDSRPLCAGSTQGIRPRPWLSLSSTGVRCHIAYLRCCRR